MMRLVVSASVLLLLLVGSTALAGVWKDDFSNPVLSEKIWHPVAGVAAEGEWEFADGMLIETANVGQDDHNMTSIIAQTEWDLEDGSIEVRGKFEEGAVGLNSWVPLYRMVDDTNGYASRVQLDQAITIGTVVDNHHQWLIWLPPPAGTIVPGEWATLRVELEGDQIRTFVNGEKNVETTDASFSKGKVGIGVGRGASPPIYIDSITVEGKGISGFSVDPSGKTAVTWGCIKSSSWR